MVRCRVLVFGSVVGLMVACASVGDGADYVIQISVDGLRPDYLQSVIAAGNAPNFKRFQARADYTHTITLPNHTSMITGRPVSQPDGLPNTTQHGYTDNGYPDPSWTLHNQGNLNVAYKTSTFDVVHDAGFSTALFASKSKFIIFEQSYSPKIGTFFGEEDGEPDYSATMQSHLISALTADPARYTFVHYANPDAAGHSYGWGSAAYNEAIKAVDAHLGELFDLVTSSPTLAGRTAIVLSADHGGDGYDHSDQTLAVDYTIPFFVWGAGVGRGDLYSLNADTRANPGTSRPTYTAIGQPIRNGDGGNLALDLLGLGPIPGSLIDAAQDLRVAAPGDFNFDGYVDALDYVVWRKSFGTPYTESDFAAWRAQFGRTPTGGLGSGGGLSSSQAVPEPALALPLLCLLGFFAVTRRVRCAFAS
jgi:type I phosphodiesterase/nucleotide pyrophosphatase